MADYSVRLAWFKDNDKRNLEGLYTLEAENPKVTCAGSQRTRARSVLPSGFIIVPECLFIIGSVRFSRLTRVARKNQQPLR